MKCLMLMSLLVSANGCAPLNSCDWAVPVRPVAGDDLTATPGLNRAVLAHNLAGVENCGWDM